MPGYHTGTSSVSYLYAGHTEGSMFGVGVSGCFPRTIDTRTRHEKFMDRAKYVLENVDFNNHELVVREVRRLGAYIEDEIE